MNREGGWIQIGFATILATILALGSLLSQRSAVIQASQRLQVLNRLEGYYETELAIWHNYNRNKDGFTVPSVTPVANGSYPLVFSNEGASGFTVAASTYDPSAYADGLPLNLARTSQVDSGQALYRRKDATSITYDPPSNSTFCGYATFAGSKSTYATCLSEPVCFDPSFGTNGKSIFHHGSNHNFGRDVRVQADGKIVVMGFDDNGSNPRVIIARRNSDGTQDTAFATSGAYRECIGSNCAHAFFLHGEIQSDGKILAIGHNRYDWSGEGVDAMIAARLNTDGGLDATFANAGRLVFNPAPGGLSYDEMGWGGILQQPADGKLILAGHWDTDNGDSPDDQYDSAIFRFHANGTLDTSFASSGKLMVDLSAVSRDDYILGTALQPDGKIIAVGKTRTSGRLHAQMIRLNSDGSFDTSFNSTGRYRVPISTGEDSLFGVAIQADGKIVVSGTTLVGTQYHWFVARLTASGALDTTFNATGFRVLSALHTDSGDSDWEDPKRYIRTARRVRILSDQRIVLVGTAHNGSNYDMAVAIVLPNGALDTSFNATGFMLIPLGALDDYGYGVAVLPDQSLILAGSTRRSGGSDFAVVKIQPGGCR